MKLLFLQTLHKKKILIQIFVNFLSEKISNKLSKLRGFKNDARDICGLLNLICTIPTPDDISKYLIFVKYLDFPPKNVW